MPNKDNLIHPFPGGTLTHNDQLLRAQALVVSVGLSPEAELNTIDPRYRQWKDQDGLLYELAKSADPERTWGWKIHSGHIYADILNDLHHHPRVLYILHQLHLHPDLLMLPDFALPIKIHAMLKRGGLSGLPDIPKNIENIIRSLRWADTYMQMAIPAIAQVFQGMSQPCFDVQKELKILASVSQDTVTPISIGEIPMPEGFQAQLLMFQSRPNSSNQVRSYEHF